MFCGIESSQRNRCGSDPPGNDHNDDRRRRRSEAAAPGLRGGGFPQLVDGKAIPRAKTATSRPVVL